jgi:uncharacterized protein (TIGR02996 family)
MLALLAAVRERPDDLGPRLVLADWLEEHGDEHDVARAEMLRCRCQLASLATTSTEGWQLLQRENDLVQRHQEAWLGPVRPWVDRWELRNGLFHVTLNAKALKGDTDQALAATEAWGWVTSVDMRPLGVDPLATRLVSSPLLDHVATLELKWVLLDDESAQALAASRHVRCLRYLDLTSQFLTPEQMAVIVASRNLNRLTRIDFSSSRVTPAHVRAFVSAARLPRLRHLDLWSNAEMEMAGITALANWPGLARLTTLDLGSCRITDSMLEALLSSPHLSNLRVLLLGGNRIRARGARALAAAPGLRKLTTLNLWEDPIGDEGAIALAGSPYLANLSLLLLEEVGIRTKGARALAASPHLNKITELNLEMNWIGPVGEKALDERFHGAVRLTT